jgi:hypothetical protein
LKKQKTKKNIKQQKTYQGGSRFEPLLSSSLLVALLVVVVVAIVDIELCGGGGCLKYL